MATQKKSQKMLDFALVATLVTVPVVTTIVGAIWGWRSTYGALGLAFAFVGMEKGAGVGLVSGLVIDAALFGLAFQAEKSLKNLRRRFSAKNAPQNNL